MFRYVFLFRITTQGATKAHGTQKNVNSKT